MSVKNYDLTIQAEGIFYGRRQWTGTEAHSSWMLMNESDSNRGEWTAVDNASSPFHRWLEFRSRPFSTYAMRFNEYDLGVKETDLEVALMRGGTDNYELGVMFKYKDKNNYYAVTYNGGGVSGFGAGNFRLIRRRGTTVTTLGILTVPTWAQQEKKIIKIYSKDGLIQIWLDGTLMFDLTDPFPHTEGAFGPIVKGQQFARYEYFKALSYSSFNASVKENNLEMDTVYSSPTNSFLVKGTRIADFMQKPVADYLSKQSVISFELLRYVIQSSNSRVFVIFDKQPNTRTSVNPNSFIYGYVEPPTIPPVQPTNLTGLTVSESSIKLAWQHSGVDVDGFYIMNDKGELIATVPYDAREHIETGLKEGTTYTRYVIAFNNAGNSVASNIVYVTTLYRLPNTPTNLRGVGVSDKEITWSWTDTSDNETGYELVDLSTGEEVIIARLAADMTSWTESGLKELTRYHRYIRSVNPRGPSELSNEAEAMTTEKLPEPPKYAPTNFTGLGISHDTIMWGWQDRNLDAEGFVFFDRQGKELFRIPYMLTYYEGDLLSDNEFGRSMAAYNKGGVGPKTAVIYAKTQPYGYGTNLAPVAPLNLIATSIDIDSAVLIWEYERNALVPHNGFYIYNAADVVVGEVDADTTTFLVDQLDQGTPYRFYVKAFNDDGLSLASNIVIFETLTVELDADFVEGVDDGFVDKMSAVVYDVETEETEKIQAFADGYGDGLDLLVHNLPEIGEVKEKFDIISKVKAKYEVETIIYPEVPITASVVSELQFKDGRKETRRTDIKTSLKKQDKEITFNHNFDMALILGDDTGAVVNQYVEIKDEYGQVVKPSTHPHITSIITKDQYDIEIGEVEDIRMDNVFTSWEKFNHSGSSQTTPSNSFWTYNAAKGAIMTTQNIQSYTGTVSPDKYSGYDMTANLSSTANDDDVMAIILAYNVAPNGRQHTLSAVRRRDGLGSTKYAEWSIVYNFAQNSELTLAAMRYDTANDDWNDYPAGIVIHAMRRDDEFEVYTSRAGVTTIDPATKLTANLNSNPQLAVFKGSSHIGVAAFSQSNTALAIEKFTGKRVVVSDRYHVFVSTTHSVTQIHYEDWFGREELHANNVIRGTGKKNLVVKLQSPRFQPDWVAMSEKYRFINESYSVSLSSKNPNVYIEYDQIEIDVESGEIYFPVDITAQIVNPEQTPWHPHIHNGYYYMKHREYFLYSETDVRAELNSDVEILEYTFPYDIEVVIETDNKGGYAHAVMQTAEEFAKGVLDDHILINLLDNTLSSTKSAKEAIYITPTYKFVTDVVDWTFLRVLGTDLTHDGDQLYAIEVSPVDEFDQPTAWYSLPLAPPSRAVKARLRFFPKTIKSYSNMVYESSYYEVENAYQVNIDNAGNGSHIKVLNPATNASGTFLTLPKAFDKKVQNYEEFKVRMDLPAGTSINVFAVSADNYMHTFHIPTGANPWIPAPFLRKDGDWYVYKNNAPANTYVSIVIELVTLGGQTPTIYEYSMGANLVEDIVITPVVSRLEVGGKLREEMEVMEYTVPKAATIVSDGAWKEVTEYTVEEEVRRYMSTLGYALSSNSTIKEYKYRVDPSLPVEIDGDYMGIYKLKARTTEEVGDAAYRQKKVTIDKDGRAIIRPIPQNGKPLVVRSAQGLLLRQVHNLNDKYEPTLDFTEWTNVVDGRYIFLENLAQHIDIRTMSVMVYYKERWVRIYGAAVVQNRIVLPATYEGEIEAKVVYRLKNSYIVDYNYDTAKDYALITVHMDYNKEVVETRQLDVIYETNKVHPYYIAEEVNLNPMLNKMAKGFIYLTDDIFPTERLEMRVKNKITATNNEELILHVYAMDIFGNPVVNQPISLRADKGTLSVKTFETDENGMVVAKLSAKGVTASEINVYAESVVYRGFTLELKETIEVHHETFRSNLRLETASVVTLGVPHEVRIQSLGDGYEYVPNVPVSVHLSNGISTTNVITDYRGQSVFNITVLPTDLAPGQKFVVLEVRTASTKEAMILGVKEV